MPNILDDIIASVVENKIPASRHSTKLSIKQEPLPPSHTPAPADFLKADVKKKPVAVDRKSVV